MPFDRKEYMARYNREYHKKRYAEDPEYRQRKIDQGNEQQEILRSDEEGKKKLREYEKRRYWKNRKERLATARRTALKRNFGITEEQYDEMVKSQNGVCAICKRVGARRLAVDHCHTTNNVRGLLCHKCNRGIGNFNDSTELLRNAISYLSAPPVAAPVTGTEGESS